jgi:A/G-specific adenine glycosylase
MQRGHACAGHGDIGVGAQRNQFHHRTGSALFAGQVTANREQEGRKQSKQKVRLRLFKLKKTKITKKYFNFIVLYSEDKKTRIEQRTKKGIWQQLYQFPLIETETSVALEDLMKHVDAPSIIPESYKELSLFNETDLIHKLSHQELHIKFWILKTSTPIKNATKWSEIKSYPVPIVIERFINNFQN